MGVIHDHFIIDIYVSVYSPFVFIILLYLPLTNHYLWYCNPLLCIARKEIDTFCQLWFYPLSLGLHLDFSVCVVGYSVDQKRRLIKQRRAG